MTVIPGNGADAGDRGQMRAADVDREQVIDVIKAAFTQGRLSKIELDERVGLALAALTYADLDGLTNDIPLELVVSSPPVWLPETNKGAGGGAHVRPRDRAIAASATLAVFVIVVAFFLNDNAVSALMALGGVASALVSLLLLGARTREQRRRNRYGLPSPEVRALRAAADRQAPARPEQLPPAKPGRSNTTAFVRAHRRRPEPIVVA